MQTPATQTSLAALRRELPALGAFAIGVAWFFWLGLGESLSPFHVLWAFDEDWSVGVMGFLFFKNAPWQFPVGSIPNYFEPFGTTIGYTDGVPSLAPIAKLLAPLLPADFQYIGPFWCFCFGALGAAGERALRRFTTDPWQRLLGGGLFAVTPVMVGRLGHPDLCAMFVLVLGLHLSSLRVGTHPDARRRLGALLLLNAFAAGTHPYIAAMSLALTTAGTMGHVWVDKVVPKRAALPWLLSPAAVSLFFFGLYGFIGFQKMDRAAEGFGEFSMDLSAFYNPMQRSRFLTAFPQHPRAFEGMQYLGLGVLLLLALRVLLWGWALRAASFRSRAYEGLRRQWPLALVVLGCAAFALSFSVRLYGRELVSLRALYEPVMSQAAMFRASGRFGWPLHFSLLMAALSVLGTLRHRVWLGRGLVAGAFALQLAETKPNDRPVRHAPLTPMPADAFAAVGSDYDRFVFAPLHLQWICRYNEKKVQAYVYEANRRRLGLNAAYVPRAIEGASALCDKHLGPGAALDPRAIYVVDDDYLRDFQRPDVLCGTRAGGHVCITDRATPFADVLRRAAP